MNPREQTVSDTTVFVVDGKGRRELKLEPSLKLMNHSPTGFNWGYGGSGPAQLALAILYDWSGDSRLALKHYQAFKFNVVAGWGDVWSITADEIEDWIMGRTKV